MVHSDVCRPLEDLSCSGRRYSITFLDDHTKYCWTASIADKEASTVLAIFKTWEAFVNRQTGRRVKAFRADGGNEYLGQFQDHCKLTGIHNAKIVRFTPEQNGKAERLNRTLLEKARCMIYQANLPEQLWSLIDVATTLRNVSPAKSMDKRLSKHPITVNQRSNIYVTSEPLFDT